MQITASIITIGDELLIGQTIDTNSAWLAQHLNQIGVWVQKRIAVGDVKAQIESTLTAELLTSNIIIITGGLGPTADDITKPLLCDFFGGTMIQNAAVEAHVRAFFEKRNRPMLDLNIAQASVPDNCEVLWNQYGTAPGMLFVQGTQLIFALPGVPLEMKDIMESSGLHKIASHFVLPQVHHRTLCTAGKGESFIAIGLKDFEQSLPSHIKLAYLPALGQVKMRLTSQNGDICELDRYFDKLATKLSHIVYAREDISIEQAIVQKLMTNQKTISLAESCTGGYIAHLFTNVGCASKVLISSYVSYTNQAKVDMLAVQQETLDQHSAVSENVCAEMAKACYAKAGSEYAIAVTGYLEPIENTEAHAWLSIFDGVATQTVKHLLPYNRQRNKELLANYALLLLWRTISTDQN
jgi:nicotinamide-nucleotide amidase